MSRISVDFFLTVSKNFVGEPFSVSLTPGIDKFFASNGYVTIFRRFFSVSQYRKTLQGNPSVLFFRSFTVAKNFLGKKGGGGGGGR